MGYTPHILVLGGGVTGTAITRDLAIRGLDVTLVERKTLTDGATGRMQGLLYSGARTAASDPDLATRCLEESRTLRTVASHCVESTGGLLVDQDGDNDFEELVAACNECGIDPEELSGSEALDREPALTDEVERALAVPDSVVDPFRLTVATAHGAVEHDATIRTHTTVVDLVVEDDAVVGALVCPTDELATVDDLRAALEETPTDEIIEGAFEISRTEEADDGPEMDNSDKQIPGTVETDNRDGRQEYDEGPGGSEEADPESESANEDGLDPDSLEAIQADYVVNATGGWADKIAAMAGVDVSLAYTRSGMVVSGADDPDHVVTRWRDTDEANTIVPQGDTAILGTTQQPAEDPEDLTPAHEDVDLLVTELADLVPAVGEERTLRAYWGVQPWIDEKDEESTPGPRVGTILDHSERDGLWGLFTVVGGTLTTHRLRAERVVDDICRMFGIARECRTDEIPLPGSEEQFVLDDAMDEFGVQSPLYDRSKERLGSRAEQVLNTDGPNPIVCECMGVTRAEIEDALDDDTGAQPNLHEARIRTWASMGECQGGLCAHRMATLLYPDYNTETVESALNDLYEERWKGQRHTLYGDQLQQAMRNYEYHVSTLNREADRTVIDVDAFDDGPEWDDDEQVRGGVRP